MVALLLGLFRPCTNVNSVSAIQLLDDQGAMFPCGVQESSEGIKVSLRNNGFVATAGKTRDTLLLDEDLLFQLGDMLIGLLKVRSFIVRHELEKFLP
jgi:hypothetical protein